MKTRIELSCVEDDLTTSLFEVKKLILSTDLVSVELKIFHDINRQEDKGHSWITVTNQSSPNELAQIYELKKQIAELKTRHAV